MRYRHPTRNVFELIAVGAYFLVAGRIRAQNEHAYDKKFAPPEGTMASVASLKMKSK